MLLYKVMNNIEISRSRVEKLLPGYVSSGVYDLSEALLAVIEQSLLGETFADFEWLIIDCSCFGDLTVLKEMPNLKRLELSSLKAEQFEALRGTNQLEFLCISGGLPPEAFKNVILPNLEELNLSDCHIPDLGGANTFSKLKDLELENSVFHDEVLEGISGIRSLRSVSLYDCRITSIEPFQECEELRRFDLSWTQVSDLSSLRNHPHIERLFLNGCPVTDIGPIADLVELKELELIGTRPSNLSPLSNHQSLLTVNLSHCELPDLTPLVNSTRPMNVVVDWKSLPFWQKRALNKAKYIRTVKLHQGVV